MRKKTKAAIKIVGVSVFAMVCISSAIFLIKQDEGRTPRISFEQLDHAPVKASILPLRNHDILYVKCVFKNAGTLNNKLEAHGISNVVAALLFKHLEGMSQEDTADKLEELGIRGFCLDAAGDDFEISFQVAREKAKDVFAFLNKAFVKPTFSEGDLNKAKDSIPTVLDPETASAYQLMYVKIFEMLYGANCAYGLRSTGTAQAIGGVTADNIRTFIKDKLSRKNLKILMAGDVTNMSARQYLDIFLEDIPEGVKNHREGLPAEGGMFGTGDGLPADSSSFSKDSKKVFDGFEKVSKANMLKTVSFLAGARLDGLSDVEKAALIIIKETLFGSIDSDFVEGLKNIKVGTNCVSKIIERSYSSVLLLYAYVDQKDAEKYAKYLEEKLAEYAASDYCRGSILGRFMDTKKYLLKLSDNGFYTLADIDKQMKRAYLPYEKVTERVLMDMLQRIFGTTGEGVASSMRSVKVVTCGKW